MTHPAQALRRAEDLVRSGQPMAALDLLAPLLSDEPDARSVLELAGRAWFRSAQLGRAERAFRRLVELDPTDAYARFVLGRVLERQHRTEEAAGCYRVAVALDPRPDYLDGLHRLTADQ